MLELLAHRFQDPRRNIPRGNWTWVKTREIGLVRVGLRSCKYSTGRWRGPGGGGAGGGAGGGLWGVVGTGIGRKSLEIEQRFHANFIIMPWKGGPTVQCCTCLTFEVIPFHWFCCHFFFPPLLVPSRFIYIPCLLNSFRLSHASDSMELSPLVCLQPSLHVYASATLRELYVCCLRVHICQAERSVAFMKALSVFGWRFVQVFYINSKILSNSWKGNYW